MLQTNPRLASLVGAASRVCVRLVTFLLSVYRVVLSPFFGPCCRFVPTCSAYTREAIVRYGVVRGTWLGMKRVLRCHPLHPGGWDPVS